MMEMKETVLVRRGIEEHRSDIYNFEEIVSPDIMGEDVREIGMYRIHSDRSNICEYLQVCTELSHLLRAEHVWYDVLCLLLANDRSGILVYTHIIYFIGRILTTQTLQEMVENSEIHTYKSLWLAFYMR